MPSEASNRQGRGFDGASSGEALVELDREEVHQSRLRRYYRLTDSGTRALSAEAERQTANARAAIERLGAWRPANAGGAE